MIKTHISNNIINFLEQDLIQNLNILGIIENSENLEIYVDNEEKPHGVLIKKDYFNYIYTNEESFLEDLIQNYFKEDFYGFSGLTNFVADKLRKHFTTHWESPCNLYYLPEGNLNLSLKKHETSDIDIKDAETIDFYYTYKNDHSLANIKENIQCRPSSAIYENGEIVCWVMVHDDNSVGIMYAKEEYRGKGYAVDVTIDLCDKIIKQGKIPFLQINIHNNMSPGLAAKCGFIQCSTATWFGGINGKPKYFYDMVDAIYAKIQDNFNNDRIYNKFIEPKDHLDFMLPLLDIKYTQTELTGFEISEAVNDNEFITWTDTAAKGFAAAATSIPGTFEATNDHGSKFGVDDLRSQLETAINKDRDHYKLFTGFLNGIPVSTLGIYMLEDEVPGLCYLSSIDFNKSMEIEKFILIGTMQYMRKIDCDIIVYHAPVRLTDFLTTLGSIKL